MASQLGVGLNGYAVGAFAGFATAFLAGLNLSPASLLAAVAANGLVLAVMAWRRRRRRRARPLAAGSSK